MQTEVLVMHDVWRQRRLPAVKFRLGVHTGHCLVGNFGCSHRVSYTCLGANVNLASRLEALNKKFGTALCISAATYAGCADDFHFRHLARVSFPGRSEPLSVYEVLCATSEDEDASEGEEPHLGAGRSPCCVEDVSPRFRRPMRGSLRMAPVETPTGKGKAAAAAYTVQMCEAGEACLTETASSISSDHSDVLIPYRWGWHGRHAVLRQATEYESAYAALVEGRYEACREMVARRRLDKAWQMLASQLEQQTRDSPPWDGVLYCPGK
eukprot:EG_transcript_8475